MQSIFNEIIAGNVFLMNNLCKIDRGMKWLF